MSTKNATSHNHSIFIAPGDCWSEGQPYMGQVRVTDAGRPCIRWEYLVTAVADIDLEYFADTSWNGTGSFCR